MLGRIIILFFAVVSLSTHQLWSQCALITENQSGQIPSSVCAPVDLTMNVGYKFFMPVDPSKVEVLFVWNDGTGATTLVPANSLGDTVFTATQNHNYPPADNCSYTAEAYIVYDGEQCTSSSRQEQTFSAWALDNENGAVVTTEPVVAQFCEGEKIVNVTFDDNSTFNCNINIEPDKPNRLNRWVQFIYGTQTIGGDRIPDITIVDTYGNTYTLTDAVGNSLGELDGPVIEIPIPADGPDQTSWSINAPAGGVAGDIFEITMRNWNICNPYDATPFDGNPPSNPVDGDYAPITTTALIEIITTPPIITNPSLEFCVNNPINLTLSTSGGDVQWFEDLTLTIPIHFGNSFNPAGPPTFIDNSISGIYSYWVVESIGACGSAPSEISFEIFDTPSPPAFAGPDKTVCSDTVTIFGSFPVIGTGIWTTTGSAVIDNPSNNIIHVSNLDPGPNLFRWTLSNGPCISIDEVIITRDLQPTGAIAGPDQSFCDNTSAFIGGNTPDNNGIGTWNIVSGGGNFINPLQPTTTINNLNSGENILAWVISSQYGACQTTSDTVRILRDVTPEPANAGADRGVCDSAAINLQGNVPTGNGTGIWTVITGSATISDADQANTLVSGLSFGANNFEWTITSQYGICSGSSDQVTITRDEAPNPAFAGLDQQLCNSVSAPLGANSASVGTGTWSVVSNPSSTNPVFNPSANNENATVQILSGDEGIYEFAWTIINESCSTSDTLLIDFGTPTAPSNAGTDDTLCGTVATLSANAPVKGLGTWTSISGPGPTNFIPDIHSNNALATINAGDEGLYQYVWTITSGACPPTSDTVNILFKPLPGIPNASGIENCGPVTANLSSTLGTNGNENKWYEVPTGGVPVATSLTYTTPLLSSDKSYWVATYNDTVQCESVRRRVDVDIHPIPDPPVAENRENCGPASLLLEATIGNNGTTNRWYDAPSGGTLLSTSQHYNTPLISDSISYWVSSYNDTTGCESARTEVQVVIHPVPNIPDAPSQSLCGPGIITLNSTIGTNGTINYWYENNIGGPVFDSALAITTPYLSSTETYWISSYNSITGCESARKEVHAFIYPIPDVPVVNDIVSCGPDSLIFTATLGTHGNTARWYDNVIGGNLLEENTQFQTPLISTNTSYWISSYNDTTLCESNLDRADAIIYPVPGANPIQGANEVGQGQTNVIYSVNYHAGSSYDWNIPTEVTVLLENQNFVILEFQELGIFTITVQETNSLGCIGPVETKIILVNEDLLFVNLNIVNSNGCVDEPFQITASPSGGTPSYSFQWTGDIGFLSGTTISNPLFLTSIPGIYHLNITVTDINDNEVTDSITIEVNPNPDAMILLSDTIVCANQELLINTQVSGGSGIYTSYEWTGDITPLSSVSDPSTVFRIPTKGYYHLNFNVEDNKGCKASDSVTIYNDSPRSAFTSDAVPQCSPVTITFMNSSEDAIEYFWNFGDNNSSDEENPVHEFLNYSTSVEYFNVQLTVTSVNGCNHISNQYVVAYPNPKTEIVLDPEVACNPADVLLKATPGGFKYNWDFGDGETEEGGYNAYHLFTNNTEKDTVFNIQLITTSFFNCYDTSISQIRVHPAPVALFEATPVFQMYPEKTVFIENLTDDKNWEYTWYFGDKTTSKQRNPGEHVYEEPDDYIISLMVKGEYCSDSAWQQIEIVPHPPIALFDPVEPGCMPLTIQFENKSAYSNTYLWEFGDGAVSNRPNPNYTYYEPGEYKIKLTATGPGGSDTYSEINSVFILPNSYFDLAPRYVYVNDEEVHFFNLSDNGDVYLWEFGDGSTSDEFNPIHIYREEGTYNVTLNVWTKNDCFDLHVMEYAVIVEPSGKIIFPNVFRPSSPLEENRIFYPGVLDQVEEYHLMIFNRWGELIFESYDREIGWDGYVDGKMSKQDVYVWKVEGKYSSGESFVKTGDVTLLH